MPTQIRTTRSVIYEGSGVQILARVVGTDGSLIQQADFGTIDFTVRDRDGDRAVATDSGALVVADVVFDTLQNDGRWTEDNIGYNFLTEISASAFPEGGRGYQVVVEFNQTVGQPYSQAWDIDTFDIIVP